MQLEARLRSAIRDIPDFPHQGIIFKDITPVLQDAVLCDDIALAFKNSFLNQKVDAIVGIESRGFLFGMLLAQKFGIPFIPVRKKGKLPARTISHEYKLEYGSATVEMHLDALLPGASVIIHDDLLATGGTAGAAAELVRRLDGHVAGFAFVVSLDFLNGRKAIEHYSSNIVSLVNY
jgi:adenine phosphoribosyltransferase